MPLGDYEQFRDRLQGRLQNIVPGSATREQLRTIQNTLRNAFREVQAFREEMEDVAGSRNLALRQVAEHQAGLEAAGAVPPWIPRELPVAPPSSHTPITPRSTRTITQDFRLGDAQSGSDAMRERVALWNEELERAGVSSSLPVGSAVGLSVIAQARGVPSRVPDMEIRVTASNDYSGEVVFKTSIQIEPRRRDLWFLLGGVPQTTLYSVHIASIPHMLETLSVLWRWHRQHSVDTHLSMTIRVHDGTTTPSDARMLDLMITKVNEGRHEFLHSVNDFNSARDNPFVDEYHRREGVHCAFCHEPHLAWLRVEPPAGVTGGRTAWVLVHKETRMSHRCPVQADACTHPERHGLDINNMPFVALPPVSPPWM